MNKITLTEKGIDILSGNSMQGGESYWVGYFGLAYVPDQSKFAVKSTRLIGEEEHGDYIYNLWQGDLVNEGHSIASDNLRKLTMYDRNITSNFRYMYDDEKDCNRLVTWTTKDDSESGSSSYVREGYHIYNGITQGESNNAGDTVTDSELPCPAPLFYAGGSASYGTAPENPADFMETVSPDWPKCKVNNYDCPMVTPDMRAYPGTWAGATDSRWNWVPQNAGKYDTLPSYITRKTAAGEDGAESLDQYAKFLSVSNFNKEHGHVSAEGYNVGYQESCHNMSMVTRLFPIASYELTATSEPSTNDPNRSERGSAKSIKYVIRMDLKSAYQGVRAYLDTLTYQKSDTEGVDPEDIALYTSKKPNSFKFNRIGIYAVPVTIRHFYKEGDAANRKDCRATHYQMEISPDAKPELFAVMQVDEVCMSEDGSFGLSDYNTTFVLNLETVSGNTSLCTNPEVYYNLAENEAITWYQNQLIATAGLSEAVTNLGVNMAHMMNRLEVGAGTGMCNQSTSEKIQMTYDGLKNLVDDLGGDGSVRGIKSATSSMPLPALNKEACKWTGGVLSFTMGDNNATLGDYSFNMTVNGDIDEDSKHILLMGGPDESEPDDTYLAVKNSESSFIMGRSGTYCDMVNSIVLGAAKENPTDGAIGSTNSLLLGCGNMASRTRFIDSIINSAGSAINEEEGDEYTYPESIKSSLWLAPAQILSDLANSDGQSVLDTYETPLKNVYLMAGDLYYNYYNYLIGHHNFCNGWYSLLKTSCTSETIRENTVPEDLAQPYLAPMAFTGGLALGGHLTDGYEVEEHRKNLDYHWKAGTYGLLKLGTGYSAGSWTVYNNHQLFENTHSTNLMVVPRMWKVYMGNEPYYTAGASDTSPDITQVYSNRMSRNGVDQMHWLVHSPHAGKPLIATEMQELDGTLHIGLGQDYMHGNTGGVTKVQCSYITSSVELQIKYQDDPSYIVRILQDGDYDNRDSRYARFSVGYTGDEAREEAGNDDHYLTHDASGLMIRCKYHYETLPNTYHEMVIDEFTVRIPTGRPNIHSFLGSCSNSYVKYANGVYPTFEMSDCTNITDTNCYVCDGWNLFGQTKRLLKFVAATASYDGATGSDSITTLYPTRNATVELERRALYRFSALNYRQHNATALSGSYIPLRMEKVAIDPQYRYLEVDAEVYDPD